MKDQFVEELAERIWRGKQDVRTTDTWAGESELAKQVIWRPEAVWIRDWLVEKGIWDNT